MYRLLIVDDEETIVNGLYSIFSNMKELDIDVYKAYSGEEAIEWLNRTRMDIVLSDIRMPEIDGLQLLDSIYEHWPQCKVIFLTGYNEFEYVYKAIQHSDVSYILKTEDIEKVIQAVENAIKEIDKGSQIEDLIHQAKEQINMALDLFQKDYFNHLLHGDTTLNIDKAQFEQLGIPMVPERPVLLLVGQVENISSELSYWDKIQYLYSVRLTIAKNMGTYIRNVLFMDQSYRFVWFIQPKGIMTQNEKQPVGVDPYKATISFLKGTLEVIQTVCRDSLNASISFVLSGEPCDWTMVSRKYDELVQLLNYRIGSGIEQLLVDDEVKKNILYTDTDMDIPEIKTDTKSLERLIRQKSMDTLTSYLESGQREEFYNTLSELITPLKWVKSKNSTIAIEAYYKVALCLLSYINRWKLYGKIAFHLGQNALMHFDKHDSWEEAVEYIYSLADVILRIQSDEQKSRADNTIHYIQQFIEEHLSEDLSLVRLAEQVYLNPSYLSRLYKQITGMNLSETIDHARITKAKQLLEKENIRIQEVSKAVGYETAASFTRFFKRNTGRSPQEYYDTYHSDKRINKN